MNGGRRNLGFAHGDWGGRWGGPGTGQGNSLGAHVDWGCTLASFPYRPLSPPRPGSRVFSSPLVTTYYPILWLQCILSFPNLDYLNIKFHKPHPHLQKPHGSWRWQNLAKWHLQSSEQRRVPIMYWLSKRGWIFASSWCTILTYHCLYNNFCVTSCVRYLLLVF